MLPLQALTSQAMEIQFTSRIFKKGRSYVAHALELDVSSCGGTKEKALRNLKEAVRLFLEEGEKMNTLEQILEEAGYGKRRQRIARPNFVSVQRVTLPLPLTHAKLSPRLASAPRAIAWSSPSWAHPACGDSKVRRY